MLSNNLLLLFTKEPHRPPPPHSSPVASSCPRGSRINSNPRPCRTSGKLFYRCWPCPISSSALWPKSHWTPPQFSFSSLWLLLVLPPWSCAMMTGTFVGQSVKLTATKMLMVLHFVLRPRISLLSFTLSPKAVPDDKYLIIMMAGDSGLRNFP